MIDAPMVLQTYLMAKQDIVDLFGSRIWPQTYFPPEDKNYVPSQGPAICFRSRGDEFLNANRILAASWQFKIYGVDEYQAQVAYRLVCDYMADARGMGILSSTIDVAGQPLEEPTTAWKYILAYFSTRMKSGLPIPT